LQKKTRFTTQKWFVTQWIKKSEELIKNQVLEIQNLKSEIESLKIVNSLLGSEENKEILNSK
jgi:hypothetical protein